jgi:hypothetical protein
MGRSNKSQFDYLLLVGTCLTVWSPIPPVVVKFFCPLTNAHHPLRRDLMNKLSEALGSPTIDPAAKAFLWFSNIDEGGMG